MKEKAYKKALIDKDLTQPMVAKRMHLSYKTYLNRMNRDRGRTLTTVEIRDLKSILDVSYARLFDILLGEDGDPEIDWGDV